MIGYKEKVIEKFQCALSDVHFCERNQISEATYREKLGRRQALADVLRDVFEVSTDEMKAIRDEWRKDCLETYAE